MVFDWCILKCTLVQTKFSQHTVLWFLISCFCTRQVSRQCWERSALRQSPQILPTAFRLDSPPLGRKYRNTPALKQEVQNPHRSVELRTENFSQLKLSSSTAAPKHTTTTQVCVGRTEGPRVGYCASASYQACILILICLAVGPRTLTIKRGNKEDKE